MIPKPFGKRSEKGSLPPGTLVHIVREKPRNVRGLVIILGDVGLLQFDVQVLI